MGNEDEPGPSPDEQRPTRAAPLERDSVAPTIAGAGVPADEALLADRYRLLQKVGEGGMGEVWEAEQLEPVRRRVAIKVIKLGMDTRQVTARFEAERQALALMNHPNVARVFDAGQTPRGRPFFAMEFVRGEPLTAYCDRHRLTTQQRLELMMSVCDGVQHAHQKGIIHRDLKPSNLLVTVEGTGQPTPKIIDFGVAKATNQHLTEHTLYTELGQLIGTPEYMSPEQAEMSGADIDTRTDVYSLGVVLYELLAGALPFDRAPLRQAGLLEIQRRIRDQEPPRPSTRVSSLGPASNEIAERRRTETAALVRRLRGDLDWITMKALEKDRTRRYTGPAELAADLRRFLRNEPVLAASPSAAYRVRKFVVRHRLAVSAAAAVLAALLAGIAGTTAGLVRARSAESRAVAALAEAVAERDRAEQARDEVAEVVQFLVGLFEVSDPGESLGKAITAREVLDRGAERIEELADRPLTQARLLATLGDVYQSLGSYEVAERQKREALAIRRRELGNDHLEVAAALDSLAALAYDRADYRVAEELSRESLAIHRRHHPAGDHRDVAAALSDVGVAISGRGSYPDAEPFYREALAMARRLPDLAPRNLETHVRRMAIALDELGRDEAAGPLYRESLALCRVVHGEVHPQVAFALDNLALFLRDTGDERAAEPLFRDSLAMLRLVYGEEHPEVAQTMGNVADFMIFRKTPSARGARADRDEARVLHRAALAMNLRLRPDHPYIGDNLASLAAAERLDGDLVEAERLVREALRVYRRKLPPGHSKVTDAEKLLAEIVRR